MRFFLCLKYLLYFLRLFNYRATIIQTNGLSFSWVQETDHQKVSVKIIKTATVIIRPLYQKSRIMTIKNLTSTLQKASNTDYDAEFIISSTSLDRDQDNFSPEALKSIANKTKKLICLFQHQPGSPCGYWSNLKFDGKNLTASLKLASTKLGALIKQLLNDDVPLSASVGFGVTDYEKNDKGGYTFLKSDMHECSVVSVPANQDAQRIKLYAKQFGFDESIFSEPSKCLEKDGKSADEKTLKTNKTIQQAKLAILNANKLNRRLS